jgi:hypothetical protein
MSKKKTTKVNNQNGVVTKAKEVAKVEVKVETTNKEEVEKDSLPRISTETLLRSKNPKEVFAGILRMLGDIELARGNKDTKKQTIYNKVSKAVNNLRLDNVDENLFEEVKLLITQGVWLEVKELTKDDKKVVKKEVTELYDKMLMFGRKNSTKDYDSIEISLFS